ncbi:MAG: hypothetical protein HGN29_06955 [Asgard group archaeon]|nr:hypothetical protein [Asgard group archaeon]
MAERKPVWGSSRYFIEIEPDTNLFSTAMSGLVSFYDTRDLINEKECINLHELVRTVYDFWATILAPHETRVARWIEEYFENMGIRSDYSLLLRLIRSEEMITQQLEEIILETLKIPTDHLSDLLGIDENTVIIGRLIKLQQLPEDELVINELVQRVLDGHQVVVPNRIKGVHQFNLGDEKKSVEIEKNINVGDTIGSYSIISTIINRYDEPIKDIDVVDQIPYSYNVLMVECDNKEAKKEQSKGEDSLLMRWKLSELGPKERVNITYYVKRRINRIILEFTENDITVLKTFENINPSDLEYRAYTKYVNSHEDQIKELYIADTIPPEFNILRTIPEAIAPQGIIERAKMKGITVRWKHTSVKPKELIEKSYHLDYFPYLYRGKKLVKDKENRDIMKCLKILQPSTRGSGYKIVYVIRALEHLEDMVSFSDRIPANHVLVNTEPAEAQIMEEIRDENQKSLTWVTNPPERNQDITVILTVSGDTQPLFEIFSVQLGEKTEVEILEKETNVERELLAYNFDLLF